MTGPADADLIKRVDATLAEFLDGRATSLAEVGPELAPVAEQARRFLDGGKRLRPSFAYWGWRTVRSVDDDDTALVSSAASLELLHACALVHDDVMDASATRRGRPATHTAFAALHRANGWTGDPDLFGAAAAILLGDLLLSWADAMFAAAALPPAVAGRTRHVYDDMRQLVMAGQYLDVLVQARGEFSADDALRVARFKTSKYTVEGPLHFGAAAAGASDETFAALSAYGLPLGEAFQLRDDVLGVFGDPAVTGKPAGDDLRSGKPTALLTWAGQLLPDTARPLLAACDAGTLDDAGVDALQQAMADAGVRERAEDAVADLVSRAHRALDDLDVDPEADAALRDLADAVAWRSA